MSEYDEEFAIIGFIVILALIASAAVMVGVGMAIAHFLF